MSYKYQIRGKMLQEDTIFRELKNEILGVLYEEDGQFIDVDDDDSFFICLEKAVASEIQSVTFLVKFSEAEVKSKKSGESK